MRKLNLPWLAGLVIFPIVFSVSIYFLHKFQLKRNAAVFKREARRAQKEGHPEDALVYLRRFIKLSPNDTEGLILYGNQLADLSVAQPSLVQPAYLILEEALRKLPADDEAEKLILRKRLLDLTMKMGRYLDSMELLENHLLKESPNDSTFLEQLARCQIANKEPQKAETSLRSALENSPDHVMTYLRLAILISNNEDRLTEADDLINQMVEVNSENPLSFLARSDWRNRRLARARSVRSTNPSLLSELSAGIKSDLQRSLELSPVAPEDLNLGARLSIASGNKDEAREFIRLGNEKHPSDTQFYKSLAELETASGNDEAATSALLKGIAAWPFDVERIPPLEREKVLELKWILANRYIDMNDVTRASEMIYQLREAKYNESVVNYLEARIPFRNSDWATAIVKMEAVRPRLLDRPFLIRQIYYWLGIAYRETNSPEQALSYFRRATTADRDWPQAQLSLAEALAAVNLLTDAVEEFRQICANPEAPVAALLGFEKTLLDLNKTKAPSLRNWIEFDAILKRLNQSDVDPSVVDLLKADRLIADGDTAGADKVMASARERNPDQPKFLTAQINLAQFSRDWERAESLIQEAEKQFGDSVTIRRLKGRLISQRNSAEEARTLLQPLSEPPADWNDTDKVELAFEFSLLNFAIGDYRNAEKLAMQAKAGLPKTLRIQLLLLDIATRGKNQKLVQQVLDEIRSETNEGAIWHYAEARRLVLLAGESKDKKEFEEAKSHLEQAIESRPSWDRIYTLWAEINELEGNYASATEQYLNAIRRGEKSPTVTGRALFLLYNSRRFVDATQLILTLRESQSPFTTEMLEIEIDLMLQLGLNEQAQKSVDKLVQERRGKIDPMWLGRSYAALEKFGLAEKSFRSAIEADKKATAPWVSLVQVLLRSKQADKAEVAIEEAKSSMEGEFAAIAIGQCYELAGNLTLAGEYYQQALKDAPNNMGIRRLWIEYLFRSNSVAQAELELRAILSQLDKDELSKDELENRRWAQLRLVDVLRVQPKLEKLDEALELVDAQLRQSEIKSPEQLRKKAQILAMYPDRDKRDEAITILEKLVEKEASITIQLEERWLLASLYQRAGNSEKSRDELRTIIIAKKDDVRALTGYILLCLQAKELGEAELYLNSLRKYSPNDFTSVDVEIQVLIARRNFAEIEKLFKLINSRLKDVIDEDEKSLRQLAIARLYAMTASRFVQENRIQELNQYLAGEAEQFFKYLIGERPELTPLYAEYFASTPEIDRALEMLQSNAADVTFPVLERTTRILMKNRYVTSEQLARIQEILNSHVGKREELVPLNLLKADLLSWRGEKDASADLFRELLRENRKNLIALNNLAVVLALFGDEKAEAVGLINEAIKIGGPLDALYDTRGMVYLANGKPEEAIVEFERALMENDNFERRFHAAVAYAKLSTTDEASADKHLKAAKKSLGRAEDFGLYEYDLHPVERKNLSKLRLQLGMPEPAK